MKYVKDLLHEMFSEDAIISAAAAEKRDDIGYCGEHNLSQKDMDRLYRTAEKHANADGGKTINCKNKLAFREKAKALMKKNESTGRGYLLYDEANETEQFAIRCFFYDSW